MIVGKDQKDYSNLQKMQKDFQPFYTLWTTVKQWKTDHNDWMNGRWENLKADQLVSSFEVCLKNMAQSVRFFSQDTEESRQKFKDLLPIAKQVKESIDEFKPVVPLAEALRKEGMVERHWQDLSKRVGFEIYPDENFTLTTVINLGMKKHVAAAEEIGEKAFKEFHIEKSLKSMKQAWENQAFTLKQFK
jgi:dynein heavy chain